MTRKISILGSTGSIGQSTLGVVDAFPELLEITALSAGRNVEILAEQVKKYRPSLVSLRSSEDARRLESLLGPGGPRPEIAWGQEGAEAVATHPDVHSVIAAIVGAAGIAPVHQALIAGKRVGIANKEVLVAAGDIMTAAARKHGGEILPVDSEHNAVHQALRCGAEKEVERIILTASGGPFLSRELSSFDSITIEGALAHPTWKMGNKISIDSATMMNKGLEVIEAHHLFGLDAERIDILIHPQSIVHSMVEFVDGSIMAQLSTTDMKFPIQYALLYPERTPAPFARLDLSRIRQLDFLDVEHDRFPAVELAYTALREGGSAPAVLNAANEVAVSRFLHGEIPFTAIVETVRAVLERHLPRKADVTSLEDVMGWDEWAREEAR
jgi:1-deoxy-D-xylulose-5-phosphate reductoisomerase